MSFAEHTALAEDEQGPYIECNVKYGETNNPKCLERSHQTVCEVGFSVG